MTEKLKTQSSKTAVKLTFSGPDWEKTNKLIQQENKKEGTRIQFRISKKEKVIWEHYIKNNLKYENITDYILKKGREEIYDSKLGKLLVETATQKIRTSLKELNPIEQRFSSLTGIKKINKQIRNSVIKSEQHLKEINKVVMNSEIPDDFTPELLIEKIQKNNIENLYLSAILNKMLIK